MLYTLSGNQQKLFLVAKCFREDFENSARIFDYMFESKSPSRSRILSSVRTAWYPKSRLKVTSEFYGLTFS
ncbi:MAG: hypothetical protein ACLRRK_08725, partial [Parasutterella sp.]